MPNEQIYVQVAVSEQFPGGLMPKQSQVRDPYKPYYGIDPDPQSGARRVVEMTEQQQQEWDAERAANPPALPVKKVRPDQARLALYELGVLDDVEAYVAQAPKPVQIQWEFATSFRADNLLITEGAQSLGWTQQFIDQLFALAETK